MVTARNLWHDVGLCVSDPVGGRLAVDDGLGHGRRRRYDGGFLDDLVLEGHAGGADALDDLRDDLGPELDGAQCVDHVVLRQRAVASALAK